MVRRLLRAGLVVCAPVVLCLCALAAAYAQSFDASGLAGENINNPTSLQFGPDGRLYVSQQNGTIFAFSVTRNAANDYQVTATETINLVKNNVHNHNDDAALNNTEIRQITGLMTAGTGVNPVLYVSSSDWRIGAGGGGNDLGLDTNSGVISRLTCSGGVSGGMCAAWDHVDIVRGLPRSEENHATNGLDLDLLSNTLYVMSGGHANKGAPSNNFAGTPEYFLAAAMLSVDLDQIEAMPVLTDNSTSPPTQYIYDLPTLDDPQRANANGISDPMAPGYDGIDLGDPFGGNNGLNQAIPEPGGPVQIYSPGFRNAYDVVLTESGDLYTWDNGPNTNWGGVPLLYDSNDNLKGHQLENGVDYLPAQGDYCTNEFHEGGSQGHGDPLHRVAGPGYYGGHPTPLRAFPDRAGIIIYEKSGSNWNQVGPRYDLADLLPAGLTLADFPNNPIECDYSSNINQLEIVSASTNGITEYTATNFSSAMQGDILAASFNGNIYRCKPDGMGGLVNLPGSSSGTSNGDCEVLLSGFGSQPLDVTAQGNGGPFPGTIWAATYGADNITIFEPNDFLACSGTDDDGIDEDGDTYSNADEIDNGTDPCNGGSQPNDNDQSFAADGFRDSDLNDPDDDDDGIPDITDAFAIDPQNGLDTQLPVEYPFENQNPGTGLFGVGFTGLMLPLDGATTWIDLYDDTELAIGGAVGLVSVERVTAGDALGNANNQANGFQFGFNADTNTAPFTVHTRLQPPYFNATNPAEQGPPQDDMAFGVFIGNGDQDNYLKIAMNANGGNGGIQVVFERPHSNPANPPLVSTSQFGNGDWGGQNILAAGQVDLYLLVDPAGNTVQPRMSLDQGATLFNLGAPISLVDNQSNPVDWFDAGDHRGPAAGLIATSAGAAAFEFGAIWDFLNIRAAPGNGDWQFIDDGLNEVRHEGAFVQAGDRFYLLGGRESRAVRIYDPASDTWSTGAQSPILLHHFQALELDGLIYAVGAMTGNFPSEPEAPNVYIYDPLRDAWITGPAMPVQRARGGGGAVAHNGVIYWISGNENGHVGSASPLADVFDPADGTFTPLPDIPNARDHFFAALHNGQIYAVGGRQSGGQGTFEPTVPQIDVFDIAGNSWSTLPSATNLNPPRAAAATGIIGNEIIVAGGESGAQSTAFADTQAFDLSSMTWRDLTPMLTPRHAAQAIVSNDGLYVVAGSPNRGGPGGNELDMEALYLFGQTSPAGTPITAGTLSAPAMLDFGNVAPGSTATQNVPLSHTGGNQALIISSVQLSGSSDFSLNQPFSGPRIIAPGGSLALAVDFDPSAGQANATLTVTEADGSQTLIALTGNASSQPTSLFRVNAAGPQIAAIDSGPDWMSDTSAANSVYLINNGSNNNASFSLPAARDASVPAYAPDVLFETERWDNDNDANGEMLWRFPTGNGDFIVRLYLINGFGGTSMPGERIFDVAVEGTVPAVYGNIDLSGQFGHQTAAMLQHTVTISDGNLELEFLHNVENPLINAIEILQPQTPPNQPPQVDPIPDQTHTEGEMPVLAVAATDNDGPQNLNYQAINLPPGLSIEPTNGQILGSIATGAAAGSPYSVTINVDDGLDTTAVMFQWTVNPPGMGTPPDAQFQQVPLALTAGQAYTTVTIGPDDRLYAMDITGNIHRWSINPDGTLANDELVITTINDVEMSQRTAIALTFDPTSTPANLIAWTTHVEGGTSGGPLWSGKITRLSGPSLEVAQDFVVGLPRSTGDHVVNSIAFGPDSALYVNIASLSAVGALDTIWNREEELLSAATLRVDISAISTPPLNVQTRDGGSYDPFVPGAPVTLYGEGIRNGYDLAWHSNGRLYVPANGSAPGGNTPASDPGDVCPNGMTYSGPAVPSINSLGTEQPDFLFKVQPGGYYGHPNDKLCHYVLNGGNPSAAADPAEVSEYPVGTDVDAAYDGFALDFAVFGQPHSHSPNGVIEYRSNHFNGGLLGRLLVARFHRGDIVAITPNGANGDISAFHSNLTGTSGLNDPLDVTEDRRNGNLYVSELGAGRITLLRPLNVALPDIDTDRDELIFSGVQNQTSPPQSVVLSNLGNADLQINTLNITGIDSGDFAIAGAPALPVILMSGQSTAVDIEFAPGAGNVGALAALLEIGSDDPDEPVFEVELYGLSALGLEGSNEPPLQQVVDTLGYAIDVGGTSLSLGTGPDPIGDEVLAPLFEKGGAGDRFENIILEPVARYSPAFVLPFGWYENNGGNPILHEVGQLSGSSSPPEHQTLFPAQIAGGNTFDPGPAVFGLYTTSPSHTAYTEDELNTAASVAHSVRIYPMKDRNGNPVPFTYLLGFEEASNGDYQDYVFVLRNVQPAGAGGNTAPSVTNPGNQNSVEGAAVNLPIMASDPDAGDVLDYSAAGLPPGLMINSASGEINGTVNVGAASGSPYAVTVTVSDGTDSTQINFTWAINLPGDLNAGLLLYWPFSESSGSSTADASGNGRDGALSAGGISFAPGVMGNAVRLTSSSGLVSDDDAENYLNGLTAISVSVWVNADAIPTDEGIFTTALPDNTDDFVSLRYDASGAVAGESSLLKGAVGNGSAASGRSVFETTGSQQTTGWQHLTLTWQQGEAARLYIDGSEDPLSYSSGTMNVPLNAVDRLWVGRGSKYGGTADGWRGLIDELRIYGRVLTAGEISQLANSTPPPMPVDDSYTFDEDSPVQLLPVLINDAGSGLSITAIGMPDNGGSAGMAGNQVQYTPAADYAGSEMFTYTVSNAGGQAMANISITINAVNDAPSIAIGSDQMLNEDAGAQMVPGFANGFDPGGGADEGGQMISDFIVGNDNNTLFAVQPDIASNGTLSYTPAADANGSAMVSVQVRDDGGTANGGQDTSPVQTFMITVNPVNDAPSITIGSDQMIDEDMGVQTLPGFASGFDPGGGVDEAGQVVDDFIISNDNNALFAAQPDIANNGTLSYTPAADASGSAMVMVQVRDDGGTANGGQNTTVVQTFTITVNAVNDEPSVTAPADVSIDEDTATAALIFTVGDAETAAGNLMVAASSANTALVPNGNIALGGGGANRTVTVTPAADGNGIAVITLTVSDADGGMAMDSFSVTVDAVNDAPSVNLGGNQSVAEDASAQNVPVFASGFQPGGGADESGQMIDGFVVSNDSNGLFAVQPAIANDGTLSYTPAADASGLAMVSVQVRDDGGTANGGQDTSAVQAFMITVNPVNDAPSITIGGNQMIDEDMGVQTLPGFAVGFDPGGGVDEAGQVIDDFIISNDNNALFAAQPDIGNNGALSYTPAADANGTATVSVQVRDDGGTGNGGQDTSAVQTFMITVNPVNDLPTISDIPSQFAMDEDTATGTLMFTINDTETAPSNLVVMASSDNTTLVPNANIALGGSGMNRTVMVVPAADQNGSAVVTLTVSDPDGGTAMDSFMVTVNAVNDAPSVTLAGNHTVDEDAGTQSVLGFATGFTPGGGPDEAGQTIADFIVSNDNMSLFAAQPDVANDGTLNFTPAAHANGSAMVTIQVQDDGSTANGGMDTSVMQTIMITVNAVNDAPSITLGGNQTVNEDAGAQLVAGFANSFSPGGGADEAGQMIADFVVSNDNMALFSVQPDVANDGTLSFTPAPDANGSAMVTIQVQDDGGTANGGEDTSAMQTVTIAVDAVNDAPLVIFGGDQSVIEDAGAQSVPGFATGFMPGGGPDEGGQMIAGFIVSNDNNALFAVQPDIANDGTLSYTPAADATGAATVMAQVQDDGSTANGGRDTSLVQTFTISVTAQAELTVTKTGSEDPVLAGNQLVYTITVSNAGPSDAVNVVATDTLSAGVSNPVTSGCAEDPNAVPVCSLGDIPAGGMAGYSVAVDVDPDTLGDIINTVSASTDTPEGDTGNNSAGVTTMVTALADLIIQMSASDDPVTAGTTLTYTLTIGNNGPSTAQAVQVNNTLPAGVTNPASIGCIEDPAGVPVCSLGDLAPGAQAGFTLNVDVPSNADGALLNTAEITSGTSDPDTGNNTAMSTVMVTMDADLSVSQIDSADPVIAGNGLIYLITVRNHGPSDAANVLAGNLPPLPAGNVQTTGCVEDPDGTPDCSLGDIPAGGEGMYLLNMDIAGDAGGQTLENMVSVTSDMPDANGANNTSLEQTVVIAVADLMIDKISGSAFTDPGGSIVYTITVINPGPSDVTGARVLDTPPARLGNLDWMCDASGGASCSNAAGTGPIDELVDIPAGGDVVFTLMADLLDTDEQPVTNTASVTAPAGLTDPVAANNTDSDTDHVGLFVDGYESEEAD